MTITFDTSILTGYYQSRLGATGSGLSGSTLGRKVAPTPPWSGVPNAAQLSASVKNALAGRKLIDENAAQLDLAGASGDYKKLFALYQGLSTLSGVAEHINGKGLTSFDKSQVERIFAKGMTEISDYVSTLKLEQARLTQGDVVAQARSKLGVAKATNEYVTPPLHNSTSTEVPAFVGDVKFTMSIKRVNTTTNVALDLNEMGATPRTFGNVINYINQKLADAGMFTRVATQRIPAEPRTITAGGKTITLPASGGDQWALKIKMDNSETVTLSAPTAANSVYLAQSVGDPDPDKKPSTNDGVTQRQLLKFQTDASTVPSPTQTPGEANWVDGRVFSETLGPEVQTVRATTVGPDGSVYMLADVNAKTAGQEIKGERDVALLKYDSAGKFLYARTLGAADEASGLGLAVSADGKVAVAGSLKGALGGATEGALNSGATGVYADKTDSFVTVFDAQGQEMWTQRRGARQDDEARNVTFGADGTVYVAGRAKSVMPGTSGAIGGWDGYIEAFKPDASGVIKPVFTESFGTASDDKPAGMVIDGTNLITAAVENGRAVLRRFDISSGTPVLAATRDLGDLQGGDIAGLALDGGQIVLAGTTRNPGLNAGTITKAHAGGSDAFAVRLSSSLAAGGGDAIAYYGGTGDDSASSLAVAGGKVFIAGSAGTDLPNQAPVGTKDGFLAELNIATGAVDWSRRFTGKDGRAAPSAIAVDTQGASVLDRLGLPKGALNAAQSGQITALSSVRPGDQFTVKVGEGREVAVTLDGKDTLDTLALKLRRATGFQAKVDIVTSEGMRYLQIKPLNDRMIIEIGAGKMDKDALAALGLPEGVVRTTRVVDGKTVPGDGKSGIYGLSLPSDLNLDDPQQVHHAVSELTTAMGVIRTIYKDLVAAASPKSAQTAAAAPANGPVPAYLTNQIANYQAALTRLTGGG